MLTRTVDIIEIHNGFNRNRQDLIIREFTMQLYVNGNQLKEFYTSPNELKELSIGSLYSEGYIRSIKDIESISLEDNNQKCLITTTLNIPLSNSETETMAGIPESASVVKNSKLSPIVILKIINEFNRKSELFSQTGAVHSCIVCDHSHILLFCEDISRHNALDKLIGKSLLNHIDLTDKMIIVSFRITRSIIKKISKTGITILVSRAAVTDEAICFSQETGLTLIGFARDRRMNIYTHNFRIIM